MARKWQCICADIEDITSRQMSNEAQDTLAFILLWECCHIWPRPPLNVLWVIGYQIPPDCLHIFAIKKKKSKSLKYNFSDNICPCFPLFVISKFPWHLCQSLANMQTSAGTTFNFGLKAENGNLVLPLDFYKLFTSTNHNLTLKIQVQGDSKKEIRKMEKK